MTLRHFLLATLCAGFLTGCAAHVPVVEDRADASASQDAQVIRGAATTTPPVTQNMEVGQAPDGDSFVSNDPADEETTATVQDKNRKAEARKPAPMKSKVVSTDLKKPVQKSSTASTEPSAQQTDPESIAEYAERARRKAEEDERRERNLKKVINSICSGC
jgi:hypothetical protein